MNSIRTISKICIKSTPSNSKNWKMSRCPLTEKKNCLWFSRSADHQAAMESYRLMLSRRNRQKGTRCDHFHMTSTHAEQTGLHHQGPGCGSSGGKWLERGQKRAPGVWGRSLSKSGRAGYMCAQSVKVCQAVKDGHSI